MVFFWQQTWQSLKAVYIEEAASISLPPVTTNNNNFEEKKSKKKRRDVKHASNFSTLQRLSIKCRGSYTPSCMTALACQGFIWTLRRLKAGSLSVFPRQIPTQLTCWAIRLCQALHIVIISYFLCPKWLDVKLKICRKANLAMTKLSYSHHMKEVFLLFVQCTKTQWHPTFTNNIYTL